MFLGNHSQLINDINFKTYFWKKLEFSLVAVGMIDGEKTSISNL